MTRPQIGAALVVVSLAVIALPAPSCAGGRQPSPRGPAASPSSRVRGFDAVAREVLRGAVACSPTVARMVADLESSDLIVGIEARPLGGNLLGEVRIVAASAGVRHLRIRLRTPGTRHDLMWVLGHELRHATEIAGAPDVRDLATQRAFCLRIGWEREGGGRFETEAALQAGRVVAKEIVGCAAWAR